MDLSQFRENARTASTEYLLDRVTVYRAEMEGPAVDVMEAELRSRGLTRAQVDAHAAAREQDGLLRHRDGTIIRCDYCPRPAVRRRWGWHWLWGWFLPLFPRPFRLCREHAARPPVDPRGRTLHFDADPGESHGAPGKG